jgi:DnaK suppressor protein
MKNNLAIIKKTLISRRKTLLSGIRKVMPETLDRRKGDDIDLAESAYEQEMAYMMKSRDAEELKVLNEAIEKIESGEYGVCEDCGKMVGEKRLEAMPFVKFCVECQSKMEQREKMEAAGIDWVE